MVYVMKYQVDGACRGNGTPQAVGVAACIRVRRNGSTAASGNVAVLPSQPHPTNQRAELRAIILALGCARERYQDLDIQARLHLTIETDSKYAVGCMNDWIKKWCENGWINSAGREVANQDLLQEALDLEEELAQYGRVVYEWIPRAENTDADAMCNAELDEIMDQRASSYSDSDSDWDC